MTLEPVNPFAAPMAETDLATLGTAPNDGELATRGERFGAAIVDGIVMLPGVVFLMASVRGESSPANPDIPLRAIGLVIYLAIYVYQWRLIARTGQSIGKRWAKIRIEHMDGSPVTFMSGVVLRAWIPLAVQYGSVFLAKVTPSVGPSRLGTVFGMVDVLLIFGASHRCLHDYIAGTRVVKVRADP